MTPPILYYAFMQKAFAVGIFISIITPLIGVVIVLRRMSLIGDALSHTSLAGVAIGLVCGLNPVWSAVISAIVFSVVIEYIRRAFPKYSEISVAVVLSIGVGISGVLSGFVKSSSDFENFLFGSIVSISDFELATVIALSVVVISVMLLLYKELFYMSFDEEGARISGVPVGKINIVFTVLTAVTVSISAKIVGALIVSSLMILPVAAAMQISKSYKSTVLYAVAIGLISTVAGLTVSYYIRLKPGSTIVLIAAAILITVLSLKAILKIRMN